MLQLKKNKIVTQVSEGSGDWKFQVFHSIRASE